MATPCQEKPWICKPRKVSFVALDADDTIWDIRPYGIASSVRGPLKKIDEDTVEAEQEPWGYAPPKEKPPPGKPPVIQVLDEETGQWVWVHKEEAKGRKIHPLRFLPTHYEKEEIDKWWVTPEEEAEVEAIAEELLESIPEKERPFFKAAKEVTGKELMLIPTEPEKEKPAAPKPEPRRITIKLKPGFRDTLNKLLDRKIKCSIISLNTEGSVKRILGAFGLERKFVQIDDSWESKDKVFAKQTEKFKVNPCDALFVDNMEYHVEGISKQGALGLVFGKDIKEIAHILNYIKSNHG